MTSPDERTVQLEIASRFELLEVVQAALLHLAQMAGFDEDAAHNTSVAVRESVVNAIKHGNRQDPKKRVTVEFHVRPGQMRVTIADEGRGFDPAAVPDPLADENLLKTDGRGIFFMRSFMDDVAYSFPPEGGTRVALLKRVH